MVQLILACLPLPSLALAKLSAEVADQEHQVRVVVSLEEVPVSEHQYQPADPAPDLRLLDRASSDIPPILRPGRV
jgi:hypothetical protein